MVDSLYPHMVQEYYVERVRQVAAARAARLAQMRTRADVIRLRDEVRRKIKRCFPRMPRRTPLNPVITGVVRRKPYRIENVLYESRPGYKVSANLYVPHGDGPFPCVLGACGHSAEGKAFDFYQRFAGGLARRGFMVLVYDPVGQGERVQLTRRVGSFTPFRCTSEHNMFGNRQALPGDFFGTWRAWDGIRGLDYLLGRPEADRTRVGVTGNSGGGTLTTYLSALDGRFTMAAPSCFVTTFLANLENELPQDAEQMPPGVLAEGLDMADYFVARIPRPVLLLGQKNDYFDCRGLRRTFEELRHLYAILGEEDKVNLFIGPDSHGFKIENREAMYRFFGRHAGRPGTVRPSESRPEKEATLHCTPGGSVQKAGSRNLALFLRGDAEAARQKRGKIGAAKLKQAIESVLALGGRSGRPHFRVLRHRHSETRKRFAWHSVFAVETESCVQAVLHCFGRDEYYYLPSPREATVYVPHVSSEDEVNAGRAPSGREIFAIDVRGVGLTQARTCGVSDPFLFYGNEYMYAVTGQMLREPYLGRRVFDLLRVLDLLAANGTRRIHLVGRGMGAFLATCSGCLHPAVKRVTLHNALRSYDELLRHPVSLWPRSCMAMGLLDRFDLPDCYDFLRRRKRLRIVAPWDHLMRRAK